MSAWDLCAALVDERYGLSLEQIARLTDEQIERIYNRPHPGSEEKGGGPPADARVIDCTKLPRGAAAWPRLTKEEYLAGMMRRGLSREQALAKWHELYEQD